MFCPKCGNSYVAGANFCSACGKGVTPSLEAGAYRETRIIRPRSPRMIAGVCSGIALHYGWDITLVRVLFAVFALCTGVGLLVYLAAWVLLPDAQYSLPQQVR